MNQVTLKIENVGSYANVLQTKLPFSKVENGSVVIHSRIDGNEPVNSHIVWLWGMIHNERRALKNAISNVAKIICECIVKKGTIHILPNAAEMFHLLGAERVFKVK